MANKYTLHWNDHTSRVTKHPDYIRVIRPGVMWDVIETDLGLDEVKRQYGGQAMVAIARTV